MGAGQSGGCEIGGSPMGYQVLRVYPNSPGSQAGLKAYFDFIVAIGQTRFDRENGSLREILKASADQKIQVTVYNTRSKSIRNVEIVPNTSWGGSGLLGVSIKHSSFDRADERVWHVVETDPGSPAFQAGFKAGDDYVIGSDSILQENDDLYNLIEAHEGKALKLFVYNVKTDNCREVICYPNSKWGGRGYLGCEFGHGLLHRIPYVSNQEGTTDSEKCIAPPMQTQPQQTMPVHSSSYGNQIRQQQPVAAVPSRLSGQPGDQRFQQALFDDRSRNQQSNNSSYTYPSPTSAPITASNQMFHQALFGSNLPQQQQQQQQPQISTPPQESIKVLPPPPPVPQTFAQLASAQYQTPQQPAQSNTGSSLPSPSQPNLGQAPPQQQLYTQYHQQTHVNQPPQPTYQPQHHIPQQYNSNYANAPPPPMSMQLGTNEQPPRPPYDQQVLNTNQQQFDQKVHPAPVEEAKVQQQQPWPQMPM